MLKSSIATQGQRPPLYYYLSAVFILAVSLYPLLMFGTSHALSRISDDAYYYIVIAQNIISSGESSFFPGELTNGYHPLWLAALVVWGKVFGLSLVSVKVLEAFVIFAGFVVFIRFFRFRSFLEAAFYTAVVWRLLWSFGMDAMETALLFPFLISFFVALLSDDPLVSARRGVILFLTGALVIGARLDAALFVVPLLVASSLSLRQKSKVFIALALTGALYAMVNQWIFGSPLPLSGAVKSMGGVQINSIYLRQVLGQFDFESLLRFQSILLSFIAAGVAAFAILLVRRREPTSLILAILIAVMVGFLLFEAKLIFLSSWRVWRWYGYPQLLFALPLIWLAVGAMNSRVKKVLMIILTFLLVTPLLAHNASNIRARAYINATSVFVEKYADLLANRNVAMGDRAGQFAYLYQGNVFQLEGLVSGVEYLEELKSGGDLRQYLCARNIDIIVDYEPPIFEYETMELNIIDSTLSSTKAATIKVSAREEIARHENPEDWTGHNLADSMIYAWQLECSEK